MQNEEVCSIKLLCCGCLLNAKTQGWALTFWYLAIVLQKLWELGKQVNEFMTWKKVECPFEKDRKILQYLLTAPIFSEDGKPVPSC